MVEFNKVEESNSYNEKSVERVDEQSAKDLEDFKNYYENASEEEKRELDEKFNKYLDEELQKDQELKNKLTGSEIKESSEITEEDMENLNVVRSLRDVLYNYPNISSPEYRAVKRMQDEIIKDLNRATQEILSNPENQEWRKIDGYN